MNAKMFFLVSMATILALPCEAADVAVVPGFDFTNVVVRVSGAPGAQVSFVDSANSPVALGAPFTPTSSYTSQAWAAAGTRGGY